ncbi:Pycsar system effector family protein [Mangrovicella endophytica]|uniref:Pycsar system effector family protein n=1 Tax=Mangrovicella endophytica TaxID=2066697 RepID=UPI000C9E2DBC|nr:Pycsar system effector family protein [Mangrovicella endophytica]
MDDRYLQYLEAANRTFVDQIKSADQKAAYVLTVVLALLVSSADARDAFRWTAYSERPLHLALIGAALSASVMVAFIAALSVTLPRIRPGRSVLYWGAWPAAGDRLIEARDGDRTDFIFDEYYQSTRVLAGICLSKFRTLRLAFLSLLAAAASYGLLLVFA